MRVHKDREDLAGELAAMLRDEKVIIMPCDTMYGFVGKAPETDPIIRSIKGRGETKPFLIVLLPEMLEEIAAEPIPEDIRRLWPGPLTVIIESRSGGTQAVRVPDDRFLCEVIRQSGAPLFSTSVNRSGQRPLNTIEDIVAQFESEVSAVVDGGDCSHPVPSTILDITCRPYKILREGALKVSRALLEK